MNTNTAVTDFPHKTPTGFYGSFHGSNRRFLIPYENLKQILKNDSISEQAILVLSPDASTLVVSPSETPSEEARQEASKAGENVSGPVGIFAILQQGTDLGYQFILFVVAVISLTLAIMNFLPIPALDGGRAFVMLLFKAMKKPLTPDLEARIHGTGFAALMILFVVITVVDIRRFY